MLPSGRQARGAKNLKVNRVGDGIYVVEKAYGGEYDFFAPSPLFPDEPLTISEEEDDEPGEIDAAQAKVDERE